MMSCHSRRDAMSKNKECPKCKGEGYILEEVLNICFPFGTDGLSDNVKYRHKKCDVCNGSGEVRDDS